MNTFYINPLNQQVVHKDPLYSPMEVWVLDQLNDELSHLKQVGKANGKEGPMGLLKRLVKQRKFKSQKIKDVEPGGWVVIETERPYSWEGLWPQAMQKLGKGETITIKP